MAKDESRKDALTDRPAARPPGDLWWWACLIVGLLGAAGAVAAGAGFPLPGG